MIKIGTATMELDFIHFDHTSPPHIAQIREMWEHYALEEFDRTGRIARGSALDVCMTTGLITANGLVVGFLTCDVAMDAIELLYIRPEYRKKGIGTNSLLDLKAACPRTLRVKPPITPGMLRLTTACGIPALKETEEEIQKVERLMAEVAKGIKKKCAHRKGNPTRGCRKCYRPYIKGAVEAGVRYYVNIHNGLSLGVSK